MRSFVTTFVAVLLLASCVYADHVLVARNSRRGGDQSDFYVIRAGQKVSVPYSGSVRLMSFGASSAELVFSRGCSNVTEIKGNGLLEFPTLTCHYNKTSFGGCFRGESTVADPFFVQGQEVFFASGVELSVTPSPPHRNAIATLRQSAYIVEPEFCEPTSTIQMVAQMYARDTLAGQYTNFFAYMSPVVRMKVNVFDFVYEGLPVVFAYHLLGDPSISDAFEQLDTKLITMTSEGNVVMANWFITVKSLQLPAGPDPQNPLNVYTDNQIHELTFDEYGRIASIDLYLNTATVFAFFPQANNPDIAQTCADIQQLCTGVNQQYTSEAACVQFMNSIAYINGPVAQSVGSNSVACRAFHTTLAGPLPAAHCFHTGPYWAGDITVTPCNDATSVWNPPPARKLARSNGQNSGTVCEGSSFCAYSVLSHEKNFHVESIKLERAMLNLLPAAGQLISAHIGSK